MAREADIGTSFRQVVDIARWIERIRNPSGEFTSRDKQPRHFSGFSEAPFGGRGQFIRGQSSRSMHLAPQPARSAPARPYYSAIPESTYRPPAIQGSSSGYSGHRGKTSGQQFFTPRGCFKCGELRHVKRFCPRL